MFLLNVLFKNSLSLSVSLFILFSFLKSYQSPAEQKFLKLDKSWRFAKISWMRPSLYLDKIRNTQSLQPYWTWQLAPQKDCVCKRCCVQGKKKMLFALN